MSAFYSPASIITRLKMDPWFFQMTEYSIKRKNCWITRQLCFYAIVWLSEKFVGLNEHTYNQTLNFESMKFVLINANCGQQEQLDLMINWLLSNKTGRLTWSFTQSTEYLNGVGPIWIDSKPTHCAHSNDSVAWRMNVNSTQCQSIWKCQFRPVSTVSNKW